MKCTNVDTGSLKVGSGEYAVGQSIRIAGEDKDRKISYVMGSSAKSNLCLCCKGTGPMPVGEVTFELVK